MSTKFKLTSVMVLMVLALTLTAAAPTAAMTLPTGCTKTHTVVGGEYLSKIADMYDVNWLDLAELNQLEDYNLIYPGQVLCISAPAPTVPPSVPLSGPVQVWASAAVEDVSVTLKGKTLDTNSTYTVYLSNYKLAVPVNILVGSVKTDSSGNFTQTFTIPNSLKDHALLRVFIINTSGDSAANWFINTTGTSNLGGIGYGGITITVGTVKEDDEVTITVKNMPADVTFSVYMDTTGTGAEEGVFVGLIHSTTGGSITKTFDIPSSLYDRSKIDLRVESDAAQLSAFVTFENGD